MLIQIDFASDLPIYRQLRDQIVIGLATGQLEAGEELPSVRRLAADLGINLHTVHKAYQQLRDEGFLVLDPRSGAVMAKNIPDQPEFQNWLSRQLEPLVAEAICREMSTNDLQTLVRTLDQSMRQLKKDGEMQNE